MWVQNTPIRLATAAAMLGALTFVPQSTAQAADGTLTGSFGGTKCDAISVDSSGWPEGSTVHVRWYASATTSTPAVDGEILAPAGTHWEKTINPAQVRGFSFRIADADGNWLTPDQDRAASCVMVKTPWVAAQSTDCNTVVVSASNIGTYYQGLIRFRDENKNLVTDSTGEPLVVASPGSGTSFQNQFSGTIDLPAGHTYTAEVGYLYKGAWLAKSSSAPVDLTASCPIPAPVAAAQDCDTAVITVPAFPVNPGFTYWARLYTADNQLVALATPLVEGANTVDLPAGDYYVQTGYTTDATGVETAGLSSGFTVSGTCPTPVETTTPTPTGTATPVETATPTAPAPTTPAPTTSATAPTVPVAPATPAPTTATPAPTTATPAPTTAAPTAPTTAAPTAPTTAAPSMPVPPVTATPTTTPAGPVVKPAAPAPRPTTSPATRASRMVTRTFQVDRYRPRTAAQARLLARLDDNGTLGYREDRGLWSANTWQFVTVRVPAKATSAQLMAAVNVETGAVGDVHTTSRLRSATVGHSYTFVWELGKGATPARAWGSSKKVVQTFVARG